MKQQCIFYLCLLLVQYTSSERNIFYPLEQQFSNIIEKLEGNPFLKSKIPKQRKNIAYFKEEILRHPVVESTSGRITGTTYPESHAFYSIPYAQVPVGELRFQPPVAVESQGEINATVPNYLNCFEYNSDCSEEACDENYSEDCLVINVNVPSTIDLSMPPSELLPVMVWLPGGAFFFGAGTEPEYDSRRLCNVTNTVVVSVNYRLGPFGFLVYDEGETRFEGNQAIKDQQLALKWVHDNIENFGGDKNEVTLFGQSAGAQSATFHLMSNESNNYFKRAILQSIPAAYYYPNKQEAKMKAEVLLKEIGCEGKELSCLRNASAWKIVNAHPKVASSDPFNFFNLVEPYRPVLDEEFPESPLELFRAGKWQSSKEVIIGVTTEEVAYVNVLFNDTLISRPLFENLTSFFVGSEFASAVTEKYDELAGNPNVGFNYIDILAQEVADMLFVCPSKAFGRYMSSTSTAATPFPPIYFYVFDYRMEAPNCQNLTEYCDFVYHASELPFVFANGQMLGYLYTENDTAIEKLFNNFWSNFVYNGSPSTNFNTWPYYADNKTVSNGFEEWSNIRIIAPNSYIENDYKKDICAFWDELGIYINTSAPTTSSPVRSDTSSATSTSAETTTSGSSSVMPCAFVFMVTLFFRLQIL